MRYFFATMAVLSLTLVQASAQQVGVKTNLLYGGATLTPNLGVEIALSKKLTLDLKGSYNPWNLNGSEDNNKKFVHWMVLPELRYWFCEKFNGHFVGIEGIYSDYNISGHYIPLLFNKDYRYVGYAYGGGISYGHHFMLGKRWGVELTLAVGVAQMRYDKYDCEKCADKIGTFDKTYFGPTNAGISIMYIIK